MPIITLPQVMLTKNVSRHWQMLPRGQNCQQLRTTGIDWSFYMKSFSFSVKTFFEHLFYFRTVGETVFQGFFCLKKRHFSLLFLRDIFTGCKILYYHYFPSSILKMSFYCPLHCIVSDETSVVIFIIVLVCSMSFSLTTFKTFSFFF